MEQLAYRTPAWLLVGMTGSTPGVLEYADGRLVFSTDQGRLFDAPLSEVHNVTFPWYYFGGGAKLTVAGQQYRLSFVRPNGASDIPGRLMAGSDIAGAAGDVLALLTAGRKIVDVGTGRQAGKRWQAILAGG